VQTRCGGRYADVPAPGHHHLGRHCIGYSFRPSAQSIRALGQCRSGTRTRDGDRFCTRSSARLRYREGLGFGDVKLAAAVGAWLPLESIPLCFALATCAALVAVMLRRLRGESIDATAKLPFGAFLCPALWLVFYASQLSG
jgi:prepilin signal peptidase PulO-like enzyme (type II secretory pathway)